MPTRPDVADLRQDYQHGTFDESHAAAHPIEQFESWFQVAVESGEPEPNAMTLSTAVDGRPSSRIVLLKDVDQRGFVFYTNYESRKGQEIARNPQVALTFWWTKTERQVRIEGRAVRVDARESDEYFNSRPRGSRLGAWASPQSQAIPSRDLLETRAQKLQEQYGEHVPIPRPPHWGGYRVVPDYIEFWQGRSSRLHDRLAYDLGEGDAWTLKRLAP